MTVFEALYKIILTMPFGKDRGLIREDFKDRIYAMTGHWPTHTEFQKAIDQAKLKPELFFLSYARGYFRSRMPSDWRNKKASLQRQIMKRENELFVAKQKI